MTEAYKHSNNDKMTLIKASVLQPFWTLDFRSMDLIAEAILSESETNIVAIRFLENQSKDKFEKIITEKLNKRWTFENFDQVKSNKKITFLENFVTYNNHKIGKVQVAFSDELAHSKIILNSIVLSMIIFVLTIFCGTLFLVYALGQQTLKLNNAVNEKTKELDQQRMALVNASRLASLGEMSAGVAHEINNPMMVIEGHVIKLNRVLKNTEYYQNVEINLKKISEMVFRVSKIVDGFRGFSRDGSTDPMTEVDVSKLFQDISDLCLEKMKTRGVTIEFICRNSETKFLGKEIQISQVLINLINNSSDAITELNEKWIKVESTIHESCVIISVTDSGLGIPLELQQKILLPFFTTKEVGKGTGLGLSISQGILENHGGELNYCASSPHTKFEIKLKRTLNMTERKTG